MKQLESTEVVTKKEYSKPRLLTHGSVQALTQSAIGSKTIGNGGSSHEDPSGSGLPFPGRGFRW